MFGYRQAQPCASCDGRVAFIDTVKSFGYTTDMWLWYSWAVVIYAIIDLVIALL